MAKGSFPSYSEETIIAVKYLIDKGITRSGEIARRLKLSPYTVRNIKKILRERGLLKDGKKTGKTPIKKAKSEDIISILLGE